MRASWDYRHVVTLEETNAIGNVYFVSFFRWQGLCRELFLHQAAPTVLEALRNGRLVLVTTRSSCDYFAELAPFDRVLIRMTLGELRQNRIVMRFEYLRENEGRSEIVARGEQEVACLERHEGSVRPTPIPEELRAALAPYGERAEDNVMSRTGRS